MKYDHKKIESKWQKYWEENKTFKTKVDRSKPKFYVLDMFPYPSGSGLHVGHPSGYTATDIFSRYKRQCGFNVLHPMGWDSFGLSAEQYAVKTGTHPAITTKQNTDTFRRQLKELGFSYDWDREITTSDSKYYKWTQWIFTKLYERGLAYEAEANVNYCPALGTVLANEEVENGKSKDTGHPVEKRPLRQWMLKITAYADRLIKDLDLVDWPESLKKLQINWIGRSEGAEIYFSIPNSKEHITAFTTRPDTLFGATYLVLAPEHPLVKKITIPEQKLEVEKYCLKASQESDQERTDLTKEKTGVFTGAYAVNPATGHSIPVWISDYVLISYGHGAIMAVPSHDERDFEFAQKFQLPIVAVIEPELEKNKMDDLHRHVLEGTACWTEDGKVINSSNKEVDLNGCEVEEAKKRMISWLTDKAHGKALVTYKLRDWLFSRQRYWGEPFPILHLDDGTKRVLDLDELPLCPPEMSDYKPSGDGLSPLAKVTSWVNITDAKTGKKATRETNTMPQWAGSCWYYLRFIDPLNENQAWDKELEEYWGAVDLYVGGVEHAVLHLLYARFWHKVLFDCGLVSTPEPFKSLRNQGLVISPSYQKENGVYVLPSDAVEKNGKYYHKETGEPLKTQVEKMSKSKLNGVSPDEIIEEFGTDSLRLYEMFMGPFDKEKVWNTDAVVGCRRFLSRFYEMATSIKVKDEDTKEGLKLGHRLVHGVTQDIEAFQFNTAIAKMMEFINDFTKLSIYPKNVVIMATQSLMPFAPHMAEEIWEILGCKDSISFSPYPKVDPKYLEDEVITYVVQVNGKLRGKFELPKDESQEVILSLAKQQTAVSKQLEGKNLVKVVFVPNKLLNIVTD